MSVLVGVVRNRRPVRRVSSAVPSWFPSSVGEAVKANTNDIVDDGITSEIAGGYTYRNAPWSNNVGVNGVFRNWNGAGYCKTLGTCGSLILFGGGHGSTSGYLGNEVYYFNIGDREFGRFNMPTYPFPDPLDYVHGELAEGVTMAAHTYYQVQTVTRSGKTHGDFVLVSHASDHMNGGAGANISHHLDIDTCVSGDNSVQGLGWSRGGAFTDVEMNEGAGTSVYDSTRNVIWHGKEDGSGWFRYDPETQTHTQVTTWAGLTLDDAGAYSPTLDAVIVSRRRGAFSSLWGFDPTDEETTPFQLTETGTTPSEGQHGFEWCPPLNAFMACTWESDVAWKLTPPAGDWKEGSWTWTTIDLAESLPEGDSAGQSGPYSQFRWISALPEDAYFVITNKAMDAYVIRLG